MNQNSSKLVIFILLLSGISYGQIVVPTANGYAIIDDYDGEEITKYRYPYIGEPSGGLCLFYKDSYFGYLSEHGNVKISNRYDVAYPFKNDFALVGKNKKYFYINDQGDKLGEVDWPRAPVVYKDFLILEDSISKVIHKDGATVLETPHKLIVTQHSGILEWNQDSNWAKQHIKAPKYGKIREANHFESVTNVATTWQGYTCVEFDSTFSIYNDRGEASFVNQPKQGYYLPVKVVWRNYLYLDNQHLSTQYENEIHSEPLYFSDHLFKTNNRNIYGPSVLLGEGFEEEGVALLRGTEKWILFDRSEQDIIGSYLFDEVLPSDDHDLLLVRQNMEWKVYSKRLDSLIATGYRFVHHRGLFNGLFLGTNDHQPYKKKKWSLNFVKREYGDLKLETTNNELYQFPESYYVDNYFSNPQIFKGSEAFNHLFLFKYGEMVVINQDGEEIYQLDTNLEPQLSLENLFMPNFYLHRLDIEPLKHKRGLIKNSVGLYLNVNDQNLEIVLANTTEEAFHQVYYDWISNRGTIKDGLIEVYLEYETKKGIWQRFTKYPGDTKADIYSSVKIPSNHKITEILNLPKGPVGSTYTVRARLVKENGEMLYSNSVQMSLSPALLYGNPYFKKYGANSKYQLITH